MLKTASHIPKSIKTEDISKKLVEKHGIRVTPNKQSGSDWAQGMNTMRERQYTSINIEVGKLADIVTAN